MKRSIVAGLDESELEILTFAQADTTSTIHWIHSKEFEFNGERYDIVSRHFSTDSVTYVCWWDSQETQLCKQLNKVLAHAFGHHPVKQERERNLWSFYKNLFSPPQNATTTVVLDSMEHNYTQDHWKRSNSTTPPSPPPQVV
ncbi:MAG: hypothetical protein KDC12_06775 [Flavobacteriales bacterium]|nr:hypothetical protein [Flavobacteriales bacterium]